MRSHQIEASATNANSPAAPKDRAAQQPDSSASCSNDNDHSSGDGRDGRPSRPRPRVPNPISLENHLLNIEGEALESVPEYFCLGWSADPKGVQNDNPVPSKSELQEFKEVKLMLKKTCYLCGNLGHFADSCSFKERLCYNCKEPGHESVSCPHPKFSSNKQCYLCKQVGHVLADCPNKKELMKKRVQMQRFNQLAQQRRSQLSSQSFGYQTAVSTPAVPSATLYATPHINSYHNSNYDTSSTNFANPSGYAAFAPSSPLLRTPVQHFAIPPTPSALPHGQYGMVSPVPFAHSPQSQQQYNQQQYIQQSRQNKQQYSQQRNSQQQHMYYGSPLPMVNPDLVDSYLQPSSLRVVPPLGPFLPAGQGPLSPITPSLGAYQFVEPPLQHLGSSFSQQPQQRPQNFTSQYQNKNNQAQNHGTQPHPLRQRSMLWKLKPFSPQRNSVSKRSQDNVSSIQNQKPKPTPLQTECPDKAKDPSSDLKSSFASSNLLQLQTLYSLLQTSLLAPSSIYIPMDMYENIARKTINGGGEPTVPSSRQSLKAGSSMNVNARSNSASSLPLTGAAEDPLAHPEKSRVETR